MKSDSNIFVLPRCLVKFMEEKLEGGCLVELDSNSLSPYVFHKLAKQLVIVTKGEGWGYIDGKLQKLSEGMIVYFKEKINHAFFTEKNMSILCFHLPMDYGDDDKEIVDINMSRKLEKFSR